MLLHAMGSKTGNNCAAEAASWGGLVLLFEAICMAPRIGPANLKSPGSKGRITHADVHLSLTGPTKESVSQGRS